ncbi:hypothetical protein CDD83_7609 [Cordyceps sp. RAO-2017]|nr:hypothetical protein CDD83_7609 [Cordyceps sp. RAO-2017]
MRADDVLSMASRSAPLGPPAASYPVADYGLVAPLTESGFVVDAVRIELLGFKPAEATATSIETTTPLPPPFDATVQFAIDGLSWPLRLAFDVDFVAAWPCARGPHPLFFDYVFRRVRVDELVAVRDWARRLYGPSPPDDLAAGDEEVLVVEAFGVRDNEVLARAWCAHWGLSAVVADITNTCMACAIREAYAATLTVVILVDDRLCGEPEDG